MNLATQQKKSLSKYFFERIPQWTKLIAARNENVFQVSKFTLVGVPIIASLVSYLRTDWSTEINLPLNLVIGYTSALTYFCACLTIDTICPTDIKKYQVIDKYLSELRPKLQNMMKEGQNPITKQSGIPADNYDLFVIRQLLERAPEEIEHTQIDDWNLRNRSLWLARVICTLFLITSGITAIYIIAFDAPKRVLENSVFIR